MLCFHVSVCMMVGGGEGGKFVAILAQVTQASQSAWEVPWFRSGGASISSSHGCGTRRCGEPGELVFNVGEWRLGRAWCAQRVCCVSVRVSSGSVFEEIFAGNEDGERCAGGAVGAWCRHCFVAALA